MVIAARVARATRRGQDSRVMTKPYHRAADRPARRTAARKSGSGGRSSRAACAHAILRARGAPLARSLVALAQSAEHRIVAPKVTGSIPVGHPTTSRHASPRRRGEVLNGRVVDGDSGGRSPGRRRHVQVADHRAVVLAGLGRVHERLHARRPRRAEAERVGLRRAGAAPEDLPHRLVGREQAAHDVRDRARRRSAKTALAPVRRKPAP